MTYENEREITVGLTTKESRRVRDSMLRAAGALQGTAAASELEQACYYLTTAMDAGVPETQPHKVNIVELGAEHLVEEALAAQADLERVAGKLEQLKAQCVDAGWTEFEDGTMAPPVAMPAGTNHTTIADVAAAIHAQLDKTTSAALRGETRRKLQAETLTAWAGIDYRIRQLLTSDVLGGPDPI